MIVATQMATYTTKMLDDVAKGAKVESRAGFKWKNKGSMVLIGDRSVSRRFESKA
jgi:NADH dehydrogenase FAD-containing subunit